MLAGIDVHATKRTVDADGGADYSSLDALLAPLQSGALHPDSVDTILFIGSDQDTYNWTTYVDKSTIGAIMFRGAASNPSSFPIVNHSQSSSSNFFNVSTASFENLILKTTSGFHLGAARTTVFKRCVIRNCSSAYAFHTEGTGGSTTFINCLFTGNTSTNIFDINFWGGTPTFIISNCTFDNNAGVWDEDPASYFSGFSITNCIFSNNSLPAFKGSNLKGITTYSLTSDSLTGYGTGCRRADDPLYGVAAKASRSAPVDWRPKIGSPAQNLGTSTNMTGVDLSDTVRVQDSTGRRDAGCWDIRDTVQSPVITSVLKDTAIGVGKPLVITMIATGTALKYSWRRVGVSTPVSDSATLKITAAALSDDNASFFCVVSNVRDSMISNTFKLHVVALPVISDQPDTVAVYLGDSASFAVVAAGENITYTWNRGATTIGGETASSYRLVTAAGDSGALFTCTATNLAGSVVSNGGLLRVLPLAPKIVSKTADTTLMESQSVTLMVKTQGKPVLKYFWYKMGDTTLLSVAESLSLSKLIPVDSVRYKCMVTNESGKDSATIRLKVTSGAPPRFVSQPLTTLSPMAGENLVMAVTASGTAPLNYTWYKGAIAPADSITAGDKCTITAIAAKDTGSYYCVVKNAFAADTTEPIVVSLRTIPQYNPLTIDAAFVDPLRAKVTIKNFLGLPFTPGASPYVDSIGIWFSTFSYPTGVLSPDAASLIKLPLSGMRKAGLDSFDTTLQFFGTIPDTCSFIYMVISPLWKQPDTVLSTVLAMQRESVYMCAAAPLVNQLVLDVEYQRVADSIVVSISNMNSLNRDSLMYLTIEYDAAGTSRFDSTDRIFPANLPAAGVNLFSRTYRSALFAGLEDSLTVRVKWRGVLGNVSIPRDKKLSIGRLRPVNTATLSIDSVGENTLYVHWNFSTAPDIDSVRIWWGKKLTPLAADFDTVVFDYLTLPKDVSAKNITALQSGTFYSAALQVLKADVWSMVTMASRDTATTRSPFQAVIPNTITNASARFDSIRNVIALSWDLDTAGTGMLENLEVGIVWSVGTAPGGTTVTVGSSGKIVTPLAIKGDSSTIDPGSALLFENTYHVALLLRRKNDATWASATTASRSMVAIPPPSWQRVSYFSGSDTVVTAFNKQVVIKKMAGTGTGSVTDTLRPFYPDVSVLRGFVAVRRFGVDFVKDNRSADVIFGMRYETALLGGRSPADIRMYQFNSDSGWRVIEKCTIDTAQQMVTIVKFTNMSTDPFILLIDTLPPEVTLADTSLMVSPGQPITNTVTIVDNVSNSSARLYYWKISMHDTAGLPSGRCSKAKNTIILTVPADSVSTVGGVRTLLVVSDGLFFDTLDVSRSVYRSTSDGFVVQGNIWTPLRTSTTLTDSSIEAALDEFKVNGKWVYDATQFRIFRWIDTAQQKGVSGVPDTNNWVEYRVADRGLFSLVPGRVVWVKTQKQVVINSLGEGATVSLKTPCTIRLRANDWTDIALPYNFDIRIGDIMRTTSADTARINRLKVYKWNFSPDDSTSYAVLKYNADMPGYDSGAVVLSHQPTESEIIGTYTIFNSNSTDVDLAIPALPASYSSYTSAVGTAAKRQSTDGEWCVTVSGSSTEGMVAPVYCAYRSGKGAIGTSPLPPGFSKQRIAVLEPQHSAACGSIVFHETPEGGYVFPLLFVNNQEQPTAMTYAAALYGKLPDSYLIGIYDPSHKKVALAGSSDQFEVSINAQTTERRWLIVGDSSFFAVWSRNAAVELSLLRVFPNPCRGDIRLQFTLPFADIGQVHIAVFNQLGQRVWNENLSGRALNSGLNSVRLKFSAKKALAAGTYLVRIAAFNSKGKITATRQQRILYMP